MGKMTKFKIYVWIWIVFTLAAYINGIWDIIKLFIH